MYNPFSLSGKNILVTGGSSGIGRSIAIECSKMGGIVFFTGRNEVQLQKTLSEMHGEGHRYFVSDLTDYTDVENWITELPILNGVVHNAGKGSRVPCKIIKENDIDSVFDINTKSPIMLQAALLTKKKIAKGASIVFIASRAADYPSVGNAVYSASKGAIISYSKVLALELAPRNIRVNSVSPAMVWTDLIIQDGITKEDFETIQLNYPLKRYGTPEDIAYLIIYLLSDASSWMTGSCLDITGGAKEL